MTNNYSFNFTYTITVSNMMLVADTWVGFHCYIVIHICFIKSPYPRVQITVIWQYPSACDDDQDRQFLSITSTELS